MADPINSNPNISAAISLADKQLIKDKLSEIKNILTFLVNLTPRQKRTLFKMGPKSIGFVQLALNVAKNHPNILPAGFNLAEFEKDVTLSADLIDIDSLSGSLAEGISDTLLAVGTEAMQQANQVYALVKVAAKSNANMNDIQQQLAERYKGQGKKSPLPPKEPNGPAK